MAEFTESIIKELESKSELDPKQKALRDYLPNIREIQDRVRKFGLNPDIEAVLTVLQGRVKRQKALSDIGPLITVFLSEYRHEFDDTLASVAVTEIENIIYERCSRLEIENSVKIFGELWDYVSSNLVIPFPSGRGSVAIGQSALQRIFTTNYDRSVETFLVRRGMVFSDGFQTDGVDQVFTGQWPGTPSLYKLHGSVNYYQREDGKIVRSDVPLESMDAYGREIKGRMMIYPIGEKYASRSPFYEYLGQLRNALLTEQVCIVIGYSFRDVPINNAFIDAVQKNRNLKILVLGPSANAIVNKLDKTVQDNAMAVQSSFGTKGSLAPQNIVDSFKSWK